MNNILLKNSNGLVFKIIEEIIYIFFILIGFYLAYLIRFNMKPELYNIEPFFDNIPYIIITSIIIFYLYEIVETLKKSVFENAITICLCIILIDIITMAIVFFNRGFAFPRSVFLIGFILQFILIFITKIIFLKVIRSHRKKEGIIIIASEEESEYITKKILLDKFNFDSIKYICNTVNDYTYKLIDEADKIFIGSDINNNEKLNIIEYCTINRKSVYLLPSFFEISLVNFKLTQINDVLLFKIGDIGLSFEQKIIKRALDLILSFIGLVIFSPVILLVSIIIKLYDRGPVFYKQLRITNNNRIFNLYKFRTMIVDAEKHTGPVLATENDPRITSIGKILRTLRIDELPQLFNVLKGDMSIVGPRPERPFFVEKYNEEIPEFKYRVFVKAGITGLAQVLGKYTTEPIIKAKYDLLYIKSYSLLLDIKIIFNTIKIMFLKDSSKGVIKDKKLDEIFKELQLDVYEEMGATRIE